jgi:hypothetical protein
LVLIPNGIVEFPEPIDVSHGIIIVESPSIENLISQVILKFFFYGFVGGIQKLIIVNSMPVPIISGHLYTSTIGEIFYSLSVFIKLRIWNYFGTSITASKPPSKKLLPQAFRKRSVASSPVQSLWADFLTPRFIITC